MRNLADEIIGRTKGKKLKANKTRQLALAAAFAIKGKGKGVK